MMSGKRKLVAVALLVFVGVVIVALAAGLPGMALRQGQPFRLGEGGLEGPGMDTTGEGLFWVVMIVRGLLAAAVIMFPLYLFISLRTRQGRQRLFGELIVFSLLLLLLSAMRNTRLQELLRSMRPAAQGTGPPDAALEAPLLAFDPSSVPGWGTQAVVVILAVLLAGGAALIAWWLYQPKRKTGELSDLTRLKLADEAKQTVDALEAGMELKDAILRCYYQMAYILAKERGLERPLAMTPAEFASELTAQGLPKWPVNELTRLFEMARYGALHLGRVEEERAVECLTAIVAAVQPEGENESGQFAHSHN